MQGLSVKPKDEIEGEGEEEGEGDLEIGGEDDIDLEEKSKKDKAATPKVNYEIIGTLQYSCHKKTEDISVILDESNPEFIQEVLKCGFVVYDITGDEKEIPKALATLAAIEKKLEEIQEMGPKTYKAYSEIRVFILISTVMTWALTKPIDKVMKNLYLLEIILSYVLNRKTQMYPLQKQITEKEGHTKTI